MWAERQNKPYHLNKRNVAAMVTISSMTRISQLSALLSHCERPPVHGSIMLAVLHKAHYLVLHHAFCERAVLLPLRL